MAISFEGYDFEEHSPCTAKISAGKTSSYSKTMSLIMANPCQSTSETCTHMPGVGQFIIYRTNDVTHIIPLHNTI